MTSDETGLQPPDGNGSKPVDYNPNEFWLRTLLRWYIGLIIRHADNPGDSGAAGDLDW